MRTAPVLIAIGLVAFAAPAVAQDTEFSIETHDVYFTLVGAEHQNPVLAVEPGATVVVTVKNVGAQPHNWQVQGIEGATIACCLANEGEGNVTFTAPSEPGEYEYFCLPHRAQGMKGVLKVGDAMMEDDGSMEDDGAMEDDGMMEDDSASADTPGFAAWGALVALGVAVALVRRK